MSAGSVFWSPSAPQMWEHCWPSSLNSLIRHIRPMIAVPIHGQPRKDTSGMAMNIQHANPYAPCDKILKGNLLVNDRNGPTPPEETQLWIKVVPEVTWTKTVCVPQTKTSTCFQNVNQWAASWLVLTFTVEFRIMFSFIEFHLSLGIVSKDYN